MNPASIVPTLDTADLEQLALIAPCLDAGPLRSTGRRLVVAADALGGGRSADVLRAWSVPFLFERMESAFASDQDPAPQIAGALAELAAFFEAAHTGGVARIGSASDASGDAPIETATAEHYGRLFERFSASSYWEEPCRLLTHRLERNGIDAARWRGKRVLDAGCGGGRYSAAWRLLGAATVVGLDLSTVGLADARERAQEAGLEGVTFEQGSVLDIPFADDAFDVVFSNGVLHHTTDWQRGVREIVRTLAPGGLGWLYLIEKPGGLFWDVVEILRVILRGRSRDVARNALRSLGLPANRVFYMLDHVMVPINVRLTPDQIVEALADAGATGVRRLERGADFDRVEHIHWERPFAREKYGMGENRFVFTKPVE